MVINYDRNPDLTTDQKLNSLIENIQLALNEKGVPNSASSLMDYFYPVGSYYETSDASFNPNRAWGGTWVLEAEGLVHIGAGTNYAVGATGGEATHTLTVDEMPEHNHNSSKNGYGSATIGASSGTSYAVWFGSGAYKTGFTGGGQAHNIMQPYVVVNRWHRTA